jgi:signal transduction histidine kinase
MEQMNTDLSTLLTNIAYRLDYPQDKQYHIKKRLYGYSIALIGLVALLSVASRYVQSNKTIDTYWLDPFTHSLFESYGGLISITIGYVLYREYRASGKRSIYYLFMAFISMAIFDFAHAYSNHSLSLFIWYHTLSAFCGGAFFLWTVVSIKKDIHDPRWRQYLLMLSGVAIIIASVWEIAYLQPILPDPFADDLRAMKHLMPVTLPSLWDFSSTMIIFNTLSALCFLYAGIRFHRYFKDTSDVVYFVFSIAALLFAESEILFAFSNLWNITWWYWHVIKLFIFTGLSIGLAHALSRSFGDLYESRRQLRSTVEELKQAYDHLKNTQEELLESEKLASIGKIAATISHEIRNPLAAIKNSAGIFKRHARLSPEDDELLDIIGKEIQRLDNIITDFLEFAKPHPLRRTMTDLNELIEETVSLLANSDRMDGRIQIAHTFDKRIPDILLDGSTMKQVLWNVLINAIQAMPQGGSITITTAMSMKTSDDGPPDSVIIDIADTGVGMQPETARKAFQPFYSTKSKGTGLGLSIVERAIKQHSGSISLESTVGNGTTVRISMPVHFEQSTITKAVNDVVPVNSR